jgi:undecaprenyl-diphosphatase
MHDLDMHAFVATYGGAHGSWGRTMIALTRLGSGWSALVLLALVGWPPARRFASALSLAILAQGTCVWAIKLVVGRVRPWIAMGLPAPPGAPHDGSFPSGHAAGSFCVAAFLFVVLPATSFASTGTRVLVTTLAIILAALIAVSRVYLGAHFPSDVVAGAMLGTLIGGAAGRLYQWRAPASAQSLEGRKRS